MMSRTSPNASRQSLVPAIRPPSASPALDARSSSGKTFSIDASRLAHYRAAVEDAHQVVLAKREAFLDARGRLYECKKANREVAMRSDSRDRQASAEHLQSAISETAHARQAYERAMERSTHAVAIRNAIEDHLSGVIT